MPRLPYKKVAPEFEQKLVDLARVTRVMAGGKRLRFRACIVIGNRKGQVGFAVAKGADVTIAVDKAARKARKKLISANLIKGTIPHEVRVKFKAAQIILKPAPQGTGVISGGAVRSVLELVGVQNVVSKILGSNNKINNVAATFLALGRLRKVAQPKQINSKLKKEKALNKDNKLKDQEKK